MGTEKDNGLPFLLFLMIIEPAAETLGENPLEGSEGIKSMWPSINASLSPCKNATLSLPEQKPNHTFKLESRAIAHSNQERIYLL